MNGFDFVGFGGSVMGVFSERDVFSPLAQKLNGTI
jgi:hypothetical protein